MLESLILENFLSFRDHTEFSFLATTEKPKIGFENIDWYSVVNNKKILKTIFLFGNNGSGKSNFLVALKVLRNLMTVQRDSKNSINERLPETCYKFDNKSIQQPSTITVVFHLNKYRYTYTISWNTKMIVYERLLRQIGRRKEEIVFVRSFDIVKDIVSISFPPKSSLSIDAQRIIRENVIHNTSVISVYDSKNFESEDLSLIYNYFESRMDFSGLDDGRLDLCSMLTRRDDVDEIHDILCAMLKCLGSNIKDFKVDTTRKKLDTQLVDFLIRTLSLEKFNERYPDGMDTEQYLRFAHERNSDVENPIEPYVWLTEGEESRGTLNMIRLMIILIDVARKNTLATIDECAMGIHQETFNRIIQFYLAISEHSQVFLATQALPVLDMDGFRRDTARFFDKDFKSGISHVESVDLRKFHANKNIYKNYVDHAFGGKPNIPPREDWLTILSSFHNSFHKVDSNS